MSEVTILPRWIDKPASQPKLRVEVMKPWLLDVWELLPTNAPNPCICQPFCCYINTVIFYLKPYTLRDHHHFYRWSDGWHVEKPGHSYEEWDRIDTALTWDSRVVFRDEEFECGGGTVLWHKKRWWMKHWARRRKMA